MAVSSDCTCKELNTSLLLERSPPSDIGVLKELSEMLCGSPGAPIKGDSLSVVLGHADVPG